LASTATKRQVTTSSPLTTDVAVRAPSRIEPPPGGVVFHHTARRASRSGAVFGYIFGALVVSSAVSYTRIYKTPAERNQLAAAFGSNRASAALFGPAAGLQTVAGFTIFKSIMTLIVLGAIWGLLTSTRLLRGEEDAGRWELLLTGQTTRRQAAAQAIGGLAVGLAALWAVAAVLSVLIGQYSKVNIGARPMLYFSVAEVATAVMFLGVGALTSQLAPTRRQAATYAGWFLGAAYAVRMIADAGVGLHGLIWASPLGWVEELQPLTAPQPLALLPIAGFTAVVAVLAVGLAGSRDVGASILPDRTHARARLRLLSGQLGLSLRLVRPTLISWGVALGITGLVLGLIAKAGGTITGSSVQTVFARLGARGTGAEAFLGVSFLILAVLASFLAAGQVTATRTEEAAGRLDHLLVRPVHRRAWLGGRVAVAVAALIVGGLIGGIMTWLGAASQHTTVSFATLVSAGLNVIPPAVCLLGVGILAFGLLPRTTTWAVYGLLGWSLFIELVGGIGADSRWLLDTSLFHQMAAAPAVSPHWTTNGVLVAIGVVCALVGAVGFTLRDIQGE
jgi:ABC-2 type transport system permease protein